MKIRGEPTRRKHKAREALGMPDPTPSLQFDPKLVLRETDFDLITKPKKLHRRGMNLAVASLLFPDLMSERTQELADLNARLSLPVPHHRWTKNPESMIFALGILKPFVSREKSQAYTKKMWEAVKEAYAQSPLLDIDDLRQLLGVKMLLPEAAPEVDAILKNNKPTAEKWVTEIEIDPENPHTATLEFLAVVLLAYPDLRNIRPLHDRLFRRIEQSMDFSRSHEPALEDPEIDSFPSVLLMTTILGNPDARIDEHGDLKFTPPIKSFGTHSTLPQRPLV